MVDLAFILRHREDCSVECTLKSVMVNLGQQVLEVLSLGNTNEQRIGSIQTGSKSKAIDHYMLNLERKVNYSAFFSKLASWQDYYF